jgi:nucleoside-triphosphatase THEP1
MDRNSEECLPVAAIVYPNEVYPTALIQSLVARCRARGMRLAGLVEISACEADDKHCDVILEDLATGHRTLLMEDRGAAARGCRLDEAALTDATTRVAASLDAAPTLLILNKFGKAECEGGGVRDLIASAIDRGIPVIIGVPQRNVTAWREFAGEFAVELPDEANEVERWLDGLA